LALNISFLIDICTIIKLNLLSFEIQDEII